MQSTPATAMQSAPATAMHRAPATAMHMARARALLVVVLATALRIVDTRQLLDLQHPGGTQQQHIDEQQVRATKDALAAGGNVQFHAPATVPGIPDQTVGTPTCQGSRVLQPHGLTGVVSFTALTALT